MDMKMRVTNGNQVRAELRHGALKVADTARGAMRRAAQRIRDEARINAPRDKWNLEEAIDIVRDTGQRGRLELTVDIKPSVNGVNVQQYAVIIHENYNSIISNDGNPDRRQGTKEKQAQYPTHIIGEKFLERAAEKERAKLQRYMISLVNKAIQETNS